MNYNSFNGNDDWKYQAEVTQQQEDRRRRPGRPSMPEETGFPGGPGFPPGGPGFPPGGPGFPPGGPGFPPGGPGFPPGGPGFPPGGPPGGFEAPRSAPPNFTPQAPARGIAVEPRNIRRCLFRFTFIWLRNGNSFWFFPVSVSRDTVAGFRWRRNGWEFSVINLRRIVFFQCY